MQRSGIYVVEVSARDNLGRLQLVTTDLYVAGDEGGADLLGKVTVRKEFKTVPYATIMIRRDSDTHP